MQYSFTQGLLSYYKTEDNLPNFLSISDSFVQHNAGEDATRIIVADTSTHYLVEINGVFSKAWGPFSSEDLSTKYLYIDVSTVDASITYGYSLMQPISSTVEPESPAVGQHWFNPTTYSMHVRSSGVWTRVVRFFIATLTNNSQIIYNTTTVPCENEAGYIVYDYDNHGVRKSDNRFLTTQDDTRLNLGTYTNAIKPEDREFIAIATENIAAYQFVAINGDKTVCLAQSSDINKMPVGMTLEDLTIGETFNIYMEGVVINEQWNFTPSQIGQFVYCSPYGEITFEKIQIGSSIPRVGKILSKNSLQLKIEILETTVSEITMPDLYIGNPVALFESSL
jgi:hypothetical protein